MRGKWNRNVADLQEGSSSTRNKYIIDEPTYKPKLLTNSPSLRAIRTYNELPVDGDYQPPSISGGLIDMSYLTLRSNSATNGSLAPNYQHHHHRRFDAASNNTVTSTTTTTPSIVSRDSLGAGSDTTRSHHDQHFYDYATLGTISITNSGSELNSEYNETGSTIKLVSSKMELSCQTWFTYISTVLCTACMAAGIGNLYRLPQMTLIRGGLPFLIAHVILMLLIGLPLVFLELGIGQLAQEGFIKSYRAIPFFKGIGYAKLLAGCLLGIYYPLYMAISLLYITWTIKGPIPFHECSSGVRMTEEGYSSVGKPGQQCLKETFLKPPYEDPFWYGIYAGCLLMLWIIITVLSIRKTKSYIRSLLILFFPMLAIFIALLVNSFKLQDDFNVLTQFFDSADWSLLADANVWYYACIQVFFSTNVGFGSFVTNAGIIHNKVNPFWTAIGYTIVNIIFGTGSVLISQSRAVYLSNTTTALNVTEKSGQIAELYYVTLIYDFANQYHDDIGGTDVKTWTALLYLLILLGGMINMATLTYTLFKAITGQSRRKLKWWHVSLTLSFLSFIIGCLFLLQPEFDLVHLMDHYIVGNLILISTIIEILALITFYGTDRIRSDFEFMLGHILSKFWLLLWWGVPILLTIIFAWGMIVLPLEGIFKQDPAWMYGIGWGIVLSATILILFVGLCVVSQQDGYTLKDRFATSMKPSKNWGPKDPMSRHNWIQWNSKAQQGERDFTLKRKGTKDYTRSIKKSKKLAISDLSSSSPISGVYNNGDNSPKPSSNHSSSHIYNELSHHHHHNNDTSTTAASLPFRRSNGSSVIANTNNDINLNHYNTKIIISTAAEPGMVVNKQTNPITGNNGKTFVNISMNDEYGTFRKGPYIIHDNVEHVCFRKSYESEDATEL